MEWPEVKRPHKVDRDFDEVVGVTLADLGFGGTWMDQIVSVHIQRKGGDVSYVEVRRQNIWVFDMDSDYDRPRWYERDGHHGRRACPDWVRAVLEHLDMDTVSEQFDGECEW
jgi:hypothetical protein